MGGLRDYFPTRAWIAILGLTTVAAVALLVPPSAGAEVGLTVGQHIAVVAAVELGCAIGVAAVVLYYRRPESERADESEWRFGP